MEAAKLSNIIRPDPSAVEDKVEQIRKKAEEEIAAMKNKAKVAYYKDNDSIAIMEDESASTGGKSRSLITNHPTTISHLSSREVVNLAREQNPPISKISSKWKKHQWLAVL